MLSILLVALFGAGIYLAWTLPIFRVSAAELSGNQMLSAEEIESVLHLNGAPVFLVVPAERGERAADELPRDHLGGGLGAAAEPGDRHHHRARARHPLGTGRRLHLGGRGRRGIPPRGEVQNLVVVSALRLAARRHQGRRTTRPRPSRSLRRRSSNPSACWRRRSRRAPCLLYDPQYGFGWVDQRGWTVWFGTDAQEMDVKLRVYSVLVDSLAQRGITPTFISVEYPGAPYYRLGQ